MNKLFLLLAVLTLTGCSALESRHHLHVLATDPDCSYQGKPTNYKMPNKCGSQFKSYYGTGYSATVIQTGPNSFTVYSNR